MAGVKKVTADMRVSNFVPMQRVTTNLWLDSIKEKDKLDKWIIDNLPEVVWARTQESLFSSAATYTRALTFLTAHEGLRVPAFRLTNHAAMLDSHFDLVHATATGTILNISVALTEIESEVMKGLARSVIAMLCMPLLTPNRDNISASFSHPLGNHKYYLAPAGIVMACAMAGAQIDL